MIDPSFCIEGQSVDVFMQNLQYVMKNKINPMASDDERENSNAFDIHKPMKAYLTK